MANKDQTRVSQRAKGPIDDEVGKERNREYSYRSFSQVLTASGTLLFPESSKVTASVIPSSMACDAPCILVLKKSRTK